MTTREDGAALGRTTYRRGDERGGAPITGPDLRAALDALGENGPLFEFTLGFMDGWEEVCEADHPEWWAEAEAELDAWTPPPPKPQQIALELDWARSA